MGQPVARHGSESYPSWAKNCIWHRYAGEPDVPGGTEYFYGDTGAKLRYEPLPVGSDFFLPKLVDCVTDPVMGFISDRTVSRWGKRRPYIFIGAILSGLSYIAMWQLSADNSQLYNFVYFLCWSCVFFIGLTIFSVPYVAMGYEMSDDYHERTRLMAVAQWIGQWAWVIAPWFWIVLYDPNWFDNATEGARTLSIWVGAICMLLAMVPAIFCKSDGVAQDTSTPHRNETLGAVIRELLSGIAVTLKCRPFQQICIATFFIFNAYNTVAGFAWFIIVYYMNQVIQRLPACGQRCLGVFRRFARAFWSFQRLTGWHSDMANAPRLW